MHEDVKNYLFFLSFLGTKDPFAHGERKNKDIEN
jgi:hypothetical protein